MNPAKTTEDTLTVRLARDPDGVRTQLLEDPVQQRVWGGDRSNLEAVFRERCGRFHRLAPLVARFCRDEHIPGNLEHELFFVYLPFADWIVRRAERLRNRRSGAYVLGINGAQGSGKTTINHLLQLILENGFGQRVVGFSIDDLYDTHQRRLEKGRAISPILARVRGPGTHDLELGIAILDALIAGEPTRIPRFDKSLAGNQGDRVAESEWLAVDGPRDIAILEGWNVGQAAFPDDGTDDWFAKLGDAEGFEPWREHYIDALVDAEHGYAALFDRLDDLVMIRIQDFAEVYANREQAEAKLRRRIDEHRRRGRPTAGMSAMSEQEVRAFVDHYEPWTLHMLDEMPGRADLVFWMGAGHRITRITANP